jgi:hypothetical protein
VEAGREVFKEEAEGGETEEAEVNTIDTNALTGENGEKEEELRIDDRQLTGACQPLTSASMQRVTIAVALFAAWLVTSGCQTFRTSHSTQTELERKRDQKAGQAVAVSGTAVYWVSEFLQLSP